MFFKKDKSEKSNQVHVGGGNRCCSDEITYDVEHGFADFGDYRITNKEVVKATMERLKSLRPGANKFKFEEVVSEALTSFDLLAYSKDQALKK